eukprot:jgi/Tetstr1/438930/TSEL_002947.t1
MVGPQRVALALLQAAVLLYAAAARLAAALSRVAAAVARAGGSRRGGPAGATPEKPAVPHPACVGVVLAQRHDPAWSLPKLASLCAWCAATPTTSLIIYDPEGVVEAHSEELVQIIKQQQALERRFTVRDAAQGGAARSFTLLAEGRACTIYLLSRRHSWSGLVDATRRLAAEGAGRGGAGEGVGSGGGGGSSTGGSTVSLAEARREAEAGRQRFREALRCAGGEVAVLEVELLMVFGDVLTLGGFPPWSLRLAEIHSLGRLQRLTEAAFRALRRAVLPDGAALRHMTDAKLRRQPSRSVGKTVSQNPHATIRSEAQSF